ncbi:MAG: ABC transporter substrate-binding protein [Xanthobacteraceae bacterium]
MKRREFITILGAAAMPFPARAQKTDRSRRLAILTALSDSELQPLLAALREKLKELGLAEGANLMIDVRATGGDEHQLTDGAEALSALRPDVMVVQGTPGVLAVRQNDKNVPIVFLLVADPVKTGLIESLARPGRNSTGITNFEFSIGGKWLDLLRQVDPRVTHVTVISNPANPSNLQFAQFIERVGTSSAMTITTASVNNSAEIETAIRNAAQETGGGLIVLGDGMLIVNCNLIAHRATQYRLPAVYPFRMYTAAGGLVSYGLDILEVYRQVAGYVNRILRGENPSDLPVAAPNKFELVVNLRAAKALGLTISRDFLLVADEVIE